MAFTVLERPITITNDERSEVSLRDERIRADEARAREFNGRISENYERLLRGEQPVVTSASTIVEERTYSLPVVETPASCGAAQRLADYVPVETPASGERRRLFEGVSYKDGVLYDATQVAEAPAVETPAVEAPTEDVPVPETVTAPVAVVADDEEEDALPTRRTMETIHQSERATAHAQQSYGVSYELSKKTQLVLAVVAMFIIAAIAIICINTSVLNSMSAELTALQSVAGELQAQAVVLEESIEAIQNSDYISQFAEMMGMIPMN